MPTGQILIVEDDDALRGLVSRVLEGEGYETAEATTGEGGIAAAIERRPALVVLDVHLPSISGYDVCRQLRARFGEHLPIIFVSGSRTEPHDRVAGLLIGADDYVSKPFLPDELLARVRRLLVRSGELTVPSNGVENGSRLTERELEVLSLLADGLSQSAIAGELHISGKTVATHIQRILVKLGVHSRAEAISYAFRHGLVSPDVVAHSFDVVEEREPPAEEDAA